MTLQEYVDWEETQQEKHDYTHGEVVARSPGTRTHHDIALNIFMALRMAQGKPQLSVFTSGMRVQVEAGRHYAYPDLSAACGALEFTDENETTFTNPALLVEVLSPKTEAYDRGEKLASSREVSSIREIVLVRQDRRAAEVYRREGTGRWSIEGIGGDGAIELASVGVTVALDDVYAKTGL